MKKLLVVLVSALAAGLFFGCSNGSDNNNAGLLLAAGSSNGGNSSVTAILPANVGENPFAGKSFMADAKDGSIKYGFDENFFTKTTIKHVPADSEKGTNAYTRETSEKFKYSYNSETKNIYYHSLMSATTIVYKNEAEEQYSEEVYAYYKFPSEEKYISAFKERYKKIAAISGEILTEEKIEQELEKPVGELRAQIFGISSSLPGGYTDSTCKTPATPAQMAYLVKSMDIYVKIIDKTIECHAYDFDGEDLKLYVSGNLPAGIKFGVIYNGTYNFSATIKKDDVTVGEIEVNPAEIIDPDNFLGHTIPSISLGTGQYTGQYLKITSATDDSVTGILQAATAASDSRSDIEELVFTDIAKITVKLENETTADKTTVTVKLPDENGNYETFGTFEIPYNNSIYSYATYTKCN